VRRVLARVGTAVLAALVPGLLAFRSGGYFPAEWGLLLLAFVLVVLACALGGTRTGLRSRDVMLVGALVGLAGWSLASAAWAPGPDGAVLAGELVLVYAAAVGAGVVALARDRVPWLLGGLLAGIVGVALWSLETRLVQGDLGTPGDVLSGTRLERPLGYANALGALAALGLLLALGLALASAAPVGRALAAGSLVPLAAVLYLTLSRGSDLACLCGLVVFCARERGRETLARTALLLVPAAAAVALAARSPLTRAGLAHADALTAGHRLAAELAALAGLGALAGVRGERLARVLAPRLRLAGAALLVVLVAGIAVAGPIRLVQRVQHRIEAPPPPTGGDLNRRVLSVSGSGRTAYWTVAWRMVERAPLLGEGAGSFERRWLRERPLPNDARNAHDLYLETLAEVGPLGLALLLVALGTPLWAARRVGGPLAAVALAGYAAWLAHVALDWDWQIPAVTLPALACGVALLVLAREGPDAPLVPRRRAALVVPAAVLLVAALAVHVGNRAADASARALDRGDDAGALVQARRAGRWAPWAALPRQLAGEAELALRRDPAARADLQDALALDPGSWIAWYDLATVTRGRAHANALRRARALNPLAPELAGLR
jgi:O-antigen ligase